LPANGHFPVIIGLAFFITHAGVEFPITFAVINECIGKGVPPLVFFPTGIRTSDVFVFYLNLTS
jgi:hypothetical protein